LLANEGQTQEPAKAGRATEGEVDWRGLNRLDEDGKRIDKDKPPPSPVTALVQNAPYRIHVASSNGEKVTITDAFTLERRRVFAGGPILGYSFSSDGHWLYVVHGKGLVKAVDVRTARARPLGQARLRAGESVVEVRGHGNRQRPYVTVVIGKGAAASPGGACRSIRVKRRLRLQQRPGKPIQRIVQAGPHELKRRLRRRGTSPNTRMLVELDGNLMSRARLGSRPGRLNGSSLPPRSAGIVWMRDSRGLFVLAHRRARRGCRYRLTLRSFRQPQNQRPSWKRQHDWTTWSLPADVEIVRGDQSHEDPQWAPDGMRMIGHSPAGVVLIEPSPRFRDHVSVIAPPSKLWPVVRPGVRSLATGVGSLRMAEILLEQGDLDAAIVAMKAPSKPDQAPPKAGEIARLKKRLNKLQSVRARRAKEFGVPLATLRSGEEPGAQTAPQAATPTTR